MSGLQIESLVVELGKFRLEIPSFTSNPGEVVSWRGPSGSGKSTLLNAVAGFLPLTSGSITLEGRRIDSLPPEKRRIALVFQRAALFPHLDVRENVEFGLRLQGIAAVERASRALEWLERFEIRELAARRPGEISEGQAQRVALARALAPGFSTLLLDEPFSALDPDLRVRLREIVREITHEKKLVTWMVTHHAEDAEAISDSIIFLESGRARVGK